MSQAATFESRVLETLTAAQVPVIVLCAPAGFGKTHVASAFAQRFDSRACLRARHGLSSRMLLDELSEPADCVVLEDADKLDEPTWKEVLERLVAGQRERSVLVVCCRYEPSTFSFTDVVDPHRLLVLRVPELQLTLDETRTLAAPTANISELTIHAIHYLTRGWLVPTLSLIRLSERGLFRESLASIGPALEDLFDWVEIHVLETLPADICDALFRCVASRDLTTKDFRRIYRHEGERLGTRLRRHVQLVSLGMAGELLPNPLIAMLLRARSADKLYRYARHAAWDFLVTGERLRAARTFVSVGDLQRASEILNLLPFEQTRNFSDFAYPGLELEYFTRSGLDYAMHPLLWLQMLPCRSLLMPSQHLLGEGERILELHKELSERLRRWISSTVAMLLTDCGYHNSADKYSSLLADSVDETPESQALHDLAQMYLARANGQYRELESRWRRAAPSLHGAASWYLLHFLTALRARVRLGNALEVQDLFGINAASTRIGAYAGLTASGIATTAVLALLRKRHKEHKRHHRDFADVAFMYSVPMLWPLLAAMDGKDLSLGSPSMPLDACACLLLAVKHTDEPRAITYAWRSVYAADDEGDLAMRVVARGCASVRDQRNASHLLSEMRNLAESTDSEAIKAAVEAYESGAQDLGVFRHFLA